ncbi:MAG: hypothetical protein WCK51_15930 [Armatimonadota bacterium]
MRRRARVKRRGRKRKQRTEEELLLKLPRKTRAALCADEQKMELPAKCCKKHKCFTRVGKADFLSMERIQELRKFIHEKKTTVDRQACVRDIIRFQTVYAQDADGRNCFTKFFLDQKQVCQTFFCFCYWISKSKLLRLVAGSGHRGLNANALPYRERSQKRRETVIWWLKEERGHHEIMPDQPKIQMPYPSRREAYRHFKLAIEMHNDQCVQDGREDEVKPLCKYNYFRLTWKTYVSDVVLRKYLRFAKCSECELLRTEYAATLDPSLRKSIRQAFGDHIVTVKDERLAYASICADARRSGTDVLSVAMDGTDQLPFGLPQFAQRLKSHQESGIRLHMEISIVHGVGVYTYLTPKCWASDPNLIVETLQRTLTHVAVRRGGSLPSTLHLRFDNCARENKNRFVIAYLADLLRRFIIKKVIVDYFMVGHTHCDPDQEAGTYLCAVKKRDIMSRTDFIKRLRESHHPSPEIEVVRSVCDWKKLCKDAGAAQDLHGHKEPRRWVMENDEKTGAPRLSFYDSVLAKDPKPIPYYPFGRHNEHAPAVSDIEPSMKKEVPKDDIKMITDFFETLKSDRKFKADPRAIIEYQEELDHLTTPAQTVQEGWRWANGGLFPAEMARMRTTAQLPPSVCHGDIDLNDVIMDEFQNQPGERGASRHAMKNILELAVGGYVCVISPPDHSFKQRFWVAKVMKLRLHKGEIDEKSGRKDFKIRVIYYHSGDGEFGRYKTFYVDAADPGFRKDVDELSDTDDGLQRDRQRTRGRVPMIADVSRSNVVFFLPSLTGKGEIPRHLQGLLDRQDRMSRGWTKAWETSTHAYHKAVNPSSLPKEASTSDSEAANADAQPAPSAEASSASEEVQPSNKRPRKSSSTRGARRARGARGGSGGRGGGRNSDSESPPRDRRTSRRSDSTRGSKESTSGRRARGRRARD